MAHIMTKQGSLDNAITYEHYCDTVADLNNIPLSQTTLGSVAIVVNDEDDGMGIYIANSQKEWTPISTSIGGGNGEISLDLIHVCSNNEYDSVTKVPTIEDAESNKIYLVPNSESGNNVFDEWIYTDEAWEKFGGGSINVPVTDVQVNSVSIVSGGVANVALTPASSNCLQYDSQGLSVMRALKTQIKEGVSELSVITPSMQNRSVFYGLAKAAGDSTQSASSNPVGSYTDEAKVAIQTMLDVPSVNDIPVESGTGLGSVKTKDYVFNETTYSNTASGRASFAEGTNVQATGVNSHAEGYGTQATKSYTHAEGYGTQATGTNSHSEGANTEAIGTRSHAEGNATQANGVDSHAEGSFTVANGRSSHVSGRYNVPDSYDNWGEWTAGKLYKVSDKVKITTTNNDVVSVNGYICNIENNDDVFNAQNWLNVQKQMNYAQIVGNGTSIEDTKNIYALDWDGNGHYMGDVYVGANADSTGGVKLATVEDIPVQSGSGVNSIVGKPINFNGTMYPNTASGQESVAIGLFNNASGKYSIAVGSQAGASDVASAAFGVITSATAHSAFACGQGNHAGGKQSFACGSYNTASGDGAHVEGNQNQAIGNYAHVEGIFNVANGNASHSEGYKTLTEGYAEHVQGIYNAASSLIYPEWEANKQYSAGDIVIYNGFPYIRNNDGSASDFDYDKWTNANVGTTLYADVVGNGTSNNVRSNAYALAWTGDGKYAGDVYVHANADSSGGTKLATIEDIPDGGRTTHNYAFDGIDLSTIYADADALCADLALEKYDNIHIGDYWPVTLNGTYRDYGSMTAPAGTTYYSDTTLTTEAGMLSENTEVTPVGNANLISSHEAYCTFKISSTTYYVAYTDCLDYLERTLQNAVILFEVAGINQYWRYGDSGANSFQNGKPHLLLSARDGLPHTLKMRKCYETWEGQHIDTFTGNGTTSNFTLSGTAGTIGHVFVEGTQKEYETDYTFENNKITFKAGKIPTSGQEIKIEWMNAKTPWTGGALYRTFNDPDYGILPLIQAADAKLYSHIYMGPNSKGMRYCGETRNKTNQQGSVWEDRGVLFLPTEDEIWGRQIRSTGADLSTNQQQWPIYQNGGRRHFAKGAGNAASRASVWTSSSTSITSFAYVSMYGFAMNLYAAFANAVAPAFLLV